MNLTKMKRLKKNFVIVVGFNILMLVVGVLLSLLLPKFLPKEEYGIYRLLTFYITYSSFIQLGYLDGVYLFFGGKNIYNEDNEETSKIFSTFILFSTVLGILFLLVFAVVLQNALLRDIYLLIIVDMMLMNFIYFYHYISQLNEKFTIYSIMFILTRLVVVISLYPLTKLGFDTGKTFIYVNIIVNVFIIIIYYLHYQKVIKFQFKNVKIETLKKMVKLGFPIFLGTVVAFLIVGIDRFVVDVFFTDIEFSLYAFAVSLTGMFIIFITAIRRLTFPYLKLLKDENVLDFKYILGVLIVLLFGFVIGVFYPLELFIDWYLPEYISSLPIIFMLMPLLIFKAEIDISISNVYKAKMLQRKYFQVNTISFVLVVMLFVVVYLTSKDLLYIAIASTVSYGGWYLISDLYLHVRLSNGGYDKYILLLIILACYYLIGYSSFDEVVKFLLYMGSMIVITILYILYDYKKAKPLVIKILDDFKNE